MILLADIVAFYPYESKEVVQQQYVVDKLDILNRYNNDGHLTQDIGYIRQQFRIWLSHYISY